VPVPLNTHDSPPKPGQSPLFTPLNPTLQTAGPPHPPCGMSHASVPEFPPSLALLSESQYVSPAIIFSEVTGMVTE